MSSFTDVFGRLVVQQADGTWQTGGINVGPCDQVAAARMLAAMAPAGWQPAAVVSSVVSSSVFLARLTDAEQLAIATAATAHPLLLVAMTRLGAATEVDLRNPQIAQFLAAAVNAGALTSERAAAICRLDT